MIAGGVPSHGPWLKTTEVVEFVKTYPAPYFGQLPSPRIRAVGTMFDNAPILCGGRSGTNILDTCISYHQDSEWTQSNSMVQAKYYAAGVKVNITTFWILGGYDGSSYHLLDYTEFIIQGQTNGVPGPKLPYGMDGMCAIKISENEIFVIGGFSGSSYMNDVWIYDPKNGFARTRGPSLTTSRYLHSCSTMRDGEKTLIVVAGGGIDGSRLDSVEIYDPSDNTWHTGKNKFQSTKILIFISYSKT